MTKKHILIFYGSKNNSYILDSLINLLNNFNYKKYNVDLYLEEDKKFLKQKLPKNVNIKEYKVLKRKIVHKIQNFLNQIIFKIKYYNKYDCAILYSIYSYAGNFVVRNASKKRILYIHSDYTKTLSDNDFREFFVSRHIYDFNNIVFVSNESKNNFLKYYPSLVTKSIVINNQIDYLTIEEKGKEKISLKINKKDINLIFVGRLEDKIKKVSLQLKLINDLRKEIPNIKLYIVGDGIDKNAYELYTKDNALEDNVIFLGEKNNPYPYIKKCDYLLLTSVYERFPVIFMESLVLKTNIISTLKISDELFSLGDNFGFLISKQYNKMKEEIKKILLNNKSNMKKFDFEKINKKRIEKLEELID